eukprot:391408_1
MAASLLVTEQKLHTEWNNICNSKDHQQIAQFFDSHKQHLLSYGTAWFLERLINMHDTKSIKYIFKQTDPQTYINLGSMHKYPIWWACANSTFEIIQLLVSNGATFPKTQGAGMIPKLFHNSTMTVSEIYLCVDYLLTKLTGKIHGCHIVAELAQTVSFNRVKMAKLIKSKRPSFEKDLSNGSYLDHAIRNQHFDFAQYLLDHGAKMHPGFFYYGDIKDISVKWLLNHGLDINGYIQSKKNNTII